MSKKNKKYTIRKPIRGINWDDYYNGNIDKYQYGMNEQDVIKILDNINLIVDQERKL